MDKSRTLIDNAAGYAAAFLANDITSDEMRSAIRLWHDMYYHQEPQKDADPCQQIAYTIVRKLTKTALSEYEATSQDKFADDVLAELGKVAKEAMQKALIGGECMLKPIPDKDRFRFNVVPRHSILVFGRDDAGNMTDIGTAEYSVDGKYYYTLLERRTVDARGYLTIRNYLYRSLAKGTLGQRAPLNSLPRYEALQDEYTFTQPVHSVGLARVKTPIENCVDGSRDGVSVYAAAVGLIRNIDRNEAQLNGEFDRGESRIVVSADMLKKDAQGRNYISDNVFVGLDEDAETVGFNIFNPSLREASFLARKQEYLRNVENVIGLKRGLLSEVEAAERTATEITSSAGDYNLTVIDFQRMWAGTVRRALHLCGILGQLYKIPGAHEVAEEDVVISWGNGVLYDEAKTDQELRAQVQQGLLQPERYLGWYYDLPCDTPEDRAKIREQYMPEATGEGIE